MELNNTENFSFFRNFGNGFSQYANKMHWSLWLCVKICKKFLRCEYFSKALHFKIVTAVICLFLWRFFLPLLLLQLIVNSVLNTQMTFFSFVSHQLFPRKCTWLYVINNNLMSLSGKQRAHHSYFTAFLRLCPVLSGCTWRHHSHSISAAIEYPVPAVCH